MSLSPGTSRPRQPARQNAAAEKPMQLAGIVVDPDADVAPNIGSFPEFNDYNPSLNRNRPDKGMGVIILPPETPTGDENPAIQDNSSQTETNPSGVSSKTGRVTSNGGCTIIAGRKHGPCE